MRTIQVLKDFDVHKVGDHVEVDDQVACDAIATGDAVPSIDPVVKEFDPVQETRAIGSAPEVK